ncbi:PepSY domain-containing protein [Massilia sp. DWR3-1-1]|uniref:PepSY domain-containing protein n=1 Tax=Massilia sp. DWR3-1-1 TaxID=2804559 RepID=UPI003CF5B0DE
MLRQFHSLPGLFAALFVILMGVTGAVLSIDPVRDRLGTSLPAGVSVATMADQVLRAYPAAQQIQRTPSGTLIVYYSAPDGAGADQVDPATGKALAPYLPSAFSRWVRQLHRSLLLDTPGRAVAGLTALVLLVLGVTGAWLLIKRVGGWRRLLQPLHGSPGQRWHATTGRVVLAGLLLSALTGTYMSAATFGVITDGMQAEPDFPASTSGGPPAPVAQLAALQAARLADLRELVFPLPGDPTAVYTLRTVQGDAYVDQSTGAALSYRAHSGWREAHELVVKLHTGQGLWWLGLLLGLCALGAPVLSITGVLVWWQRRQAMPRIVDNSAAATADVVILVGSENNSTWGFALALHNGLRAAGRQVHTAPMNALSARYRTARQLFLLTATYGDGDAPSSANHFLALLERLPANPQLQYAVLGFGDRQFPQFCQFARDADAAMQARGWQRALELVMINRQSAQEFTRWGDTVGSLLGVSLKLDYVPVHPPTMALCLAERIDYGEQASEPTVVLRFRAGRATAATGMLARLLPLLRPSGLPRFEAGDLLGVIAPGSPMPRFYSLASGADNGFVEICVRKQPGGLCSGYLHALKPGQCIDAFIQANPQFRPQSGKAPVILIGAGTGIGPLAGFIRNNTGKHPMYLYWGGRDPESDFLYEPELKNYLADRRLTQLQTAFSRVENGVHVQSRLEGDADKLRELIGNGGQVLVCGSSAMAGSVRSALDAVLAPVGESVQTLRTGGRYREDVF